jgi:hypothetical protein
MHRALTGIHLVAANAKCDPVTMAELILELTSNNLTIEGFAKVFEPLNPHITPDNVDLVNTEMAASMDVSLTP